MNKKKSIHKKYRSLKQKSIIFLSTIFLGLYLISCIIFFGMYYIQIKKNYIISNINLTNQIGLNLDNYIKDWNRMAMSPMYDNEVLSILKEQNKNMNMISAAESQKMYLFLSALSYGHNELSGITMIAENGRVFSDRYINPITEQTNYANLIQEHRAQGGVGIVPLHEVDYYTSGKKNVFSLVKEIKQPYTEELLGTIKIDVETSFFKDKLLSLGKTKFGLLTIMDHDQNIFFSTKDSNQGEMENIIYEYQSKQSVLKIRSEVSTALIIKEIRWVIWLYLITVSISLLVIALAILISFNRIMNPLIVLKNKMMTIKIDDINIKLDISRNDEIGDLVQGYNLMLDNIKDMMNQIEEVTRLQKDAEFYALRSQINPHFLNNTLEMINMLAIKSNVYDISDIVANLGKLMSYTTLKNKALSTIEEEITIIKAFAEICKLRFEHVAFEYHLDEELESYTIPRFLLQPLIENAVIHGVEEREGLIVIEITRDNDSIKFSITDNGKGMSHNEIAEIRKIINIQNYMPQNKTNKGIALRNINQRLIMLYGMNSRLNIQSNLHRGSCFYFRLPMEKE